MLSVPPFSLFLLPLFLSSTDGPRSGVGGKETNVHRPSGRPLALSSPLALYSLPPSLLPFSPSFLHEERRQKPPGLVRATSTSGQCAHPFSSFLSPLFPPSPLSLPADPQPQRHRLRPGNAGICAGFRSSVFEKMAERSFKAFRRSRVPDTAASRGSKNFHPPPFFFFLSLSFSPAICQN